MKYEVDVNVVVVAKDTRKAKRLATEGADHVVDYVEDIDKYSNIGDPNERDEADEYDVTIWFIVEADNADDAERTAKRAGRSIIGAIMGIDDYEVGSAVEYEESDDDDDDDDDEEEEEEEEPRTFYVTVMLNVSALDDEEAKDTVRSALNSDDDITDYGIREVSEEEPRLRVPVPEPTYEVPVVVLESLSTIPPEPATRDPFRSMA